MQYKGKIADWNNEKGFGFINPDEGGKNVFVHISSFADRQARPMANQAVSYELKADEKGRIQAIKVVCSTGRFARTALPMYAVFPLIFSVFFIVFLALMVLTEQLGRLVTLAQRVQSLWCQDPPVHKDLQELPEILAQRVRRAQSD